jgi:hypothetical protein
MVLPQAVIPQQEEDLIQALLTPGEVQQVLQPMPPQGAVRIRPELKVHRQDLLPHPREL